MRRTRLAAFGRAQLADFAGAKRTLRRRVADTYLAYTACRTAWNFEIDRRSWAQPW